MTMTRRTFVERSAVVAAPLAQYAWTAPALAQATPPGPDNLAATALVEATHPRIVALAKEITQSIQTDRAAAVAVHDWVRDQIPFGLSRGFYETSATEVLDAKAGYCNTKVSLFNALLRARGIPTRMRMMDLSAQVLLGLFDPGTLYIDHAVTEVFLAGAWVKVDSYVVDKPLANAAARRLTATGAKAGFGIHGDGKSDWDGRSHNFIQCLDNGAIKDYVLKDHGVFVDVADFYQRASAPRNRKTLVSGLMTRLGAPSLNQKIQAIRVG